MMLKRKNKDKAAKAKPVKRMAAKAKKPAKTIKADKAVKPGPEKEAAKAKPEAAAKIAAPGQPNNAQAAPQEIANLPIIIHGQYVRDASFENPNAPQALRAGQTTPQMNVNFGLDARTLNEAGLENMFEVMLSINVEATREGKPVFIAEVQYGTTVSIGASVPQEQRHPLLLIEVPRLAFPFARQILSEMVVQGGYPPLLLAPVNFQQLYVERFKNDLAKKAKQQA